MSGPRATQGRVAKTKATSEENSGEQWRKRGDSAA
jgi:hypothetical protein